MSFKPTTILLHSEYIWSNSNSVSQCSAKQNWILLRLHHSRTFLQGQEHAQLCWRVFPHPDAVTSSTETLWILYRVSWRTVGLKKPRGTWCTAGCQGSPFTGSRAPGSCCFFSCRLQSKYCKAHSKARLRTQCYFRTATCYTTGSYPFFLLK